MPDGADETHPGSELQQRMAQARERAGAARQGAEDRRRHAQEVRVKARQLQEGYAKMLAARGPIRPAAPEGRTDDAPEGVRLSRLRGRAADLSEQMAQAADDFASYMELAAERGDREYRLGVAAAEREIAGVERRNAARLRRGDGGLTDLESLPQLPSAKKGTSSPGDRG